MRHSNTSHSKISKKLFNLERTVLTTGNCTSQSDTIRGSTVIRGEEDGREQRFLDGGRSVRRPILEKHGVYNNSGWKLELLQTLEHDSLVGEKKGTYKMYPPTDSNTSFAELGPLERSWPLSSGSSGKKHQEVSKKTFDHRHDSSHLVLLDLCRLPEWGDIGSVFIGDSKIMESPLIQEQ